MSVLDGYIRVSRVGGREGEGFISPDVQEQAILRWAKEHGHEVVFQPHELDVSGGTMDRPVFNAIMERVRTGRSAGIVVYKLDRFARTVAGALNTLAELGEHDALFASATEPTLDYSTPAGRAFMQQMFVFAEFVRSTAKESWYTAQVHAIERGVPISPVSYLGYAKGADGRLVPDEHADHVREVFRRRGEGETWDALAGFLNAVAPKAQGAWTAQAVQRMCAKRVYLGEVGRFVTQDVDGRGPVVNREAHPALVTEAEWQAAQMTQPRIGGRRPGEPLPLLAGLVRCAGCRFSLSRGRGPKGEVLYRCRGKHASGACTSPASILAEALEAHVEDAVLREVDGMVHLVPDSGERDRAVAALESARADLDGFRRDREARRKLGSAWHDWLDDYLAAVREAEDALAVIDARAGRGAARADARALPSPPRRRPPGGPRRLHRRGDGPPLPRPRPQRGPDRAPLAHPLARRGARRPSAPSRQQPGRAVRLRGRPRRSPDACGAARRVAPRARSGEHVRSSAAAAWPGAPCS